MVFGFFPRKICLFLLAISFGMLLSGSLAYADPVITWELPTPDPGNVTSNDWVYLNATITDSLNTSAFFDWNYSLLGYWSFDFYNATGIYDNSSYQNFGTFNGVLGASNITTGKYGDALEFNNETSDYLNCGNDVSLQITGEITVEAWTKKISGSAVTIISKYNPTGGDRGYTLRVMDDNTIHFHLANATGTGYDTAYHTYPATEDWTHLAATWDGSNMYVYVNGVAGTPTAKTDPIFNSTQNLLIGRYGSSTPTYFNGTIDEVRIWSRALSPEEINASYNNGAYRLQNNFTGLANGQYNYTAWAIDEAGNMNSSTRNVTVNVTSECGNLTESTTLINDVGSDGTCFFVKSGDIVLDCDGYTISYSQASTGYAVNNKDGFDNITIRNCNIVQGGSYSNSHAIYYEGSDGGAIEDNDISTAGYHSKDIHLYGSSGISILNNNLTSTGGDSAAVNLEDSSYMNISGNAMDTPNGIALIVQPTNTVAYYNHTIDTTNTEQGETVYYYFNQDSITLENTGNVGILWITASNNVTANNLTMDKDGIYVARTENSTIANSSINIVGTDTVAFFLRSLSNSNKILNNNITTESTASPAVLLWYNVNSNVFSNNNIHTKGANSWPVWLSGAVFNTSFTGGSILADSSLEYRITTASATNSFRDTNFTGSRMIYFGASSAFNYNNETAGGVWVNTSASALSIITRELTDWTQSLVRWNDTNTSGSGITATYNISGLVAATYCHVYNNSVLAYTLQTDANGELPSFTIGLNGEREIRVEQDLTKPTIEWETPTPAPGEGKNQEWIYLNTTITDISNTSAFFDWNRSLVGYWSFEYANATGIHDNSTYQNFGSFGGSGPLASGVREGKYGKGLEFDGVNDNIDIPDGPAFDLEKNNFTVEMWVRLNEDFTSSSSTSMAVLAKYDEPNYNLHLMFWGKDGSSTTPADGSLTFKQEGEGSGVYSNTSRQSWSADTWYHIVVIRGDSDFVDFYVNGELDSSRPGVLTKDITLIDGDLQVGGGAVDDGTGAPEYRYFNGTIDEVRIWNRALGPEEIKASYNNGAYSLKNNFTNLTKGTYEYEAWAIDLAGNMNTSFRSVTVDFTPDIFWESPTPPDDNVTSNDWVYLNATVVDVDNTSALIDWDRSLVGYWSFEYASATGIYDNSTYGNTATFTGSGFGTGSLTAGKYGQALDFDGSNDYLRSSSTSFNLRGDKTLEAWVFVHSFSPDGSLDRRIITKGIDSGNAYQLSVVQPQTGFGFSVDDGGTQYRAFNNGTTSGYSINTWYHLTGTYNDTSKEIRLYVNGIYDSESTFSRSIPGEHNLKIGTYNSTAGFFNGLIDEVRIWNRALSGDEINASYNNKAYRLERNFTNLEDGTYDYAAWAIDEAGNMNSTGRAVTVDYVPNIIWEKPTPLDDFYWNRDFVYLNATIEDLDNTSALFDWNYSLLGYWSFDFYNNTGIFDNSTYENFGTFYYGLGEGSITSGKYGQGLEFDGSGQYLDCGNGADLGANSFTFEAWVKKPASQDSQSIVHKNSTLTDWIGALHVSGSLWSQPNKALFWVDGYTYRYSTVEVSDGNWHHIVGVCNRSKEAPPDLYVDGQLDNGVGYTGNCSDLGYVTGGGELEIGRQGLTGYNFNGTMDEVRIYSRALGSEEINASYNNGLYRLENNLTGLTDGTYDYGAWAIDGDGNMNSSYRNLTIETVKPYIKWEDPTPEDGIIRTDDYVYLNTTITDGLNTSALIDWNYSLVGHWSFDSYNSTHVFDSSSYGNDGSVEYANATSVADVADTNGTQCVDDDALQAISDTYNGWTFEATSGGAAGNSTIVNDYVYYNDSYRILYLQDDIGNFQQGDSYRLWYDLEGPQLAKGKFGSAMEFDGQNDVVDCGNDASLDITGNITIEAWVKYGDLRGYPRIVSKYRATAYALRIRGNGNIELAANIGGVIQGNDMWSTGTFNEGEWAHVAATYDGAVINYYTNGLYAGSATPDPAGPIGTNSYPLYIGGEYLGSASQYFFNGSIDEVRIYNRVLSGDEINASYNNGAYRLHNNFTGLPDGAYDYEALAIDQAGNMNSTGRTVTVDSNPPVITWEPPTPDDGVVTADTDIYLNTTITDATNTSAFFDWNRSLVGYWSFDYANATGIFDNSTYGNFGTFGASGPTAASITEGKYGNALEFDGTDDYVDCGNDSSLNITGAMTMEAWVNMASVTAEVHQVVVQISGEYATAYQRLQYKSDQTQWRFIIYNGTDFLFSHWDDASPTGEWLHLVGTFDGVDTTKLYVNGIMQDGDTGATSPINENLCKINNGNFNGSIDEVRIYNRELSAEEINASYNNKAYRLEHNFTNLTKGAYEYGAWAIDQVGHMSKSPRSFVIHYFKLAGKVIFWENATAVTGAGVVAKVYDGSLLLGQGSNVTDSSGNYLVKVPAYLDDNKRYMANITATKGSYQSSIIHYFRVQS